jgi:hypothetical protein
MADLEYMQHNPVGVLILRELKDPRGNASAVVH